MENEGKVLCADGKIATIAVKRESACAHSCADCAGCMPAGLVMTDAINTIGAKAGDSVIFEESTKGILRKALMLYVVPIVLFFLAFFIGMVYYDLPQNMCMLLGLLGFIAGLCLAKLYDLKAKKRQELPIIARIL